MKVLTVTAMYPEPDNPAFGSFVRTQVESLEQAGIEIELLVLKGHPRKLIYAKGVFQLRRRLSDGSIDLVHGHYSFAGMVARAQNRVPVVVTYHGDDILGTVNPNGKTTLFSRVAVVGGQMLARVVDAVIVQSKEMADKFSGVRPYIIPHEVDLDLFRPVRRDHARAVLGLDPDRKYLLFAANPKIPVKRFPLAKATVEYLAHRDPTVELLVVYKETQDRLALYMNACDALVFPSFQEGSPNVVKQSMACNLPIVATDVGDVRDVIGNTKGCYVCRPDVVQLAEKLGEVLRFRPRTRGRDRVRGLDRQTVARQVIQVYDDVLRTHKSR